MSDTDTLAQIIEPEVNALGFALVRVKLTGSAGERTLQVMAERPETRQLVIEDCAQISRRLSDRLDALEAEGRDPVQGAYRLEVSSPGIDRPLTRAQDFADWAGHDVKISFAEKIGDRRQISGVIEGFSDGEITITDRKGKTVTFGYDKVHSAQLILTDRLIAATVPLSTEGAEEVFTEEMFDADDIALEDDENASAEIKTEQED